MVICNECKNCKVHVGYWICEKEEEKTVRDIEELFFEKEKACSFFKR